MKPERIQGHQVLVTPERLREKKREIAGWQVEETPNAIIRHFPQASFKASAAFLTKVAPKVEEHGRASFAFVDATGVTVRLGSPPRSGVTETDLELAAALNTIS